MLIVDSQVHIWENVMLNKLHRQVMTFSRDDLLAEMAEAGVDAALLHPPGTVPTGNATAMAAAEAHPDRFAILGWFEIDQPGMPETVANWTKQPGQIGLRFTFMGDHQKSWPTDGSLEALLVEMEKAGMPLGLLAHTMLPLVGGFAERHPGVNFLIDHFGVSPMEKDDKAFATLPDLLALARHPNVGVKVSGAPSNSSDAYPYRNIHDHIRRIFDAFGPERCFWGTDLSRMPCSYRECVTMFTEEMPWLAGRDLELVMGRALCNWIGWDLPEKT